MIVNTLSFGALEIDPQDIYDFPEGIPGFEDNLRYIIVQPDPTIPFCYIQSIEESALAFLVCNPFLFFADYDFQLSESNELELGISDEKDISIWSVITLNRQNNEASMNLLAPIVVNIREKRGKQIILHHTDYQIKHKLSFPDSGLTTEAEG